MRLFSLFVSLVFSATTVISQELPREWIDPDTGHRVVRLSDERGSASLYFHQNAYTPNGEKLIITSVNADETLLAGIIDEGPPAPPPSAQPGKASRGDSYPGKGEMMERRLAERRPLRLITISSATGEVKTLLRGTDWYNHIQFSPTDPTLLMFCHEGPWHKVDRTWTIRTDGTALTDSSPDHEHGD